MSLLSRYAECMFWLARYVERAENLARILEVQATFARDSKGTQDWRVVLQINADADRFRKVHAEPTAEAVLSFYLLERGNPTSLISNLYHARENARTLRSLISTEMWTQLNVFHKLITGLSPAEVTEDRLARLCSLVKQGCEAHFGITAGTFYRDEAWSFYQLGAAIECADQTTRLLDAKYLALEGRVDAGDTAPGSATDISYWTAVLRSVAAYQAFRRVHGRGMNPEQVAAFLICDPSFPRSVACNVGTVAEELTRLRRRYRLKGTEAALERLDALTASLDVKLVREAMAQGRLHEFNDSVQRDLAGVTAELGVAFFGHGPPQRQRQRSRQG